MEKLTPLEKRKFPKPREVLVVLVLAVVYFLAGKAGLTLAFVQSNATAIWAPTGISLAALLIFGTKAWPGVFLGALAVNLATPHTGWSAPGIAVGNTLEALTGAALVNRFARGRESLQLSGDILRFAILGGLAAPLVSATLGVASLLLGGLTTLGQSPVVWVTWWLGDMGGAVLVAPLLILWANYRPARFNGRKALELAALFLILFFMGWVEFGGATGLSTRNYPFQFIFVPLLLWAAVGFGTLETATATFALTILAVWGTVHGFGPFKGPDDNASLLFLQSFMSVTGVTVLILAASVSERKLTEELLRINRILEEEIGERKGLEKSLQESNENFRLLSEASREGVLLSAGGIILGANQNFCGMFGYALDEVIGSHSTDYVADECKALVQSHISLNDDSRYEIMGRRKNGATFLMEVSSRTVTREGNSIRLTALRDISGIRKKEEEVQQLQLLVENSLDFIAITSLDAKWVYLNRAGRKMLGIEEGADITALSPADFFFSQDVETGRNNRSRLLEDGYWEGEFRFRHPKTGEPIPLHFLSVLIRDPQTGRPTGGASIGRDLSQQRLAHEKLLEKTADLELLKAVAVASNQAVDLEEAMKIAVTEICRLTHWPVGHVYLLSEDGKTLRPSGIWYFDEPERFETFRRITEATTFLAGEGLPGRILASGKPLAIPDVSMDSNFPRARQVPDIGVKGCFGFPVLIGKETAAVLEFFSSRAETVDRPFLELMEHVGAQLGRVLERRRASEMVEKREKHFRALIENSLDVVSILAADGTVMYESPSVERIAGYSPQEMDGQNIFTYIHPEDMAAVRKVFTDVLEKPGNIGTIKFRFRHKDGSWRNLESIGANLLGDPAVKGVVVNTRDITPQEESQRSLRESEERFHLMVNGVKDYAIFLVSPEGLVMNWNEGAQRIKGYSAEEIVGRPLSTFYAPEDVQAGKPEAFMEKAAREGRAETEGWRVRKDGTRFWANVILTALRDERGQLKGFAKITRDISARRQIEELARSNKELEQFAYVASHDLQEPLRMVASYVQLLARRYKGRLDEDADIFIRQAVEGVVRMQTLINDLLTYSRLGTDSQDFKSVALENVLAAALNNLETRIRESGAQVTHDPLPEVQGDFQPLVQLFQNLIGNAVKFRGKDPPKIHVGASSAEREWVFYIQDNGIGIDPQYSDRIFEVFKRLHSRSEYPGTGIGLAICKKVVIQHGGRIWVESKEGEGSVFRWTLPIKKGAALEQPV